MTINLLISELVMISLTSCFIQAETQKAIGNENRWGYALVLGVGQTEPHINEPYLRLNAEELRAFVGKANTIKLGDTRQSVESLLGKPWSDYRMRTKEKGKFIGRFVDYYVLKYDKDLVNERWDEWITFKFGADDCLRKIYSRVPGIPNQP